MSRPPRLQRNISSDSQIAPDDTSRIHRHVRRPRRARHVPLDSWYTTSTTVSLFDLGHGPASSSARPNAYSGSVTHDEAGGDHAPHKIPPASELPKTGGSPAQELVISSRFLQRSRLHAANDWTIPSAQEHLIGEPRSGETTRESFDLARAPLQRHMAVKEIFVQAASASDGPLGRRRSTSYNTANNGLYIEGHRIPLRKTSLPIGRELQAQPHPLSPVLEGARANDSGSQRTLIAPEAGPNLNPFTGVTGWQWDHLPPRDEDANGLVRQGSRRKTVLEESALVAQDAIQRSAAVAHEAINTVAAAVRRSSLYEILDKARVRGVALQRTKPGMIAFEYGMYLLYLCIIYFVLIGVPLWNGAVWWLFWVVAHKFVVAGTWAITISIATFYAYAPLLILLEKTPSMPDEEKSDPTRTPGVHNCALIIPCYKSAKLIAATLDAATRIFPPHHIFVIANGNSPMPLDNTEEVCRPYGVNHVWSPVGSKIVAQFVGCYAAKEFENVLLIDDDCALPPNFPIVTDRMGGNVLCYGYMIKSVGPLSSRGTLAQQAQDLEYKLSGIQRAFAGDIGSATFPHGAIALWNRDFLIKTFHYHPGFSVSEDWFFGHVARQLGSRCKMCTSVFIETETPDSVFFASSGAARGGFGEMTIFKQRFMRWNFFFVNGIYYNMSYILGSWRLGFWEIGAKIFVFEEVYETLLYLIAPFFLPICFAVRPAFTAYLFAGTFGIYYLNALVFNEIHLRLKNERVPWRCTYFYYPLYKAALTFVNILSCYWAIWKYAKYFAKRHAKIIEDERAVGVVLKLEESRTASHGRRMTVDAVGAESQAVVINEDDGVAKERKMTITTMGAGTRASIDEDSRQGRLDSITVEVAPGQRFSFSIGETTDARDFASESAPILDTGTVAGITVPERAASRAISRRTTSLRSSHSELSRRSSSLRPSLTRNGSSRYGQRTMQEGSPDFDALMDRFTMSLSAINEHD